MKKKIPQEGKRTFTLKSHEIPATQAMLYAVRDELISRSNSHETRFDSVDARFQSLEHKLIAEIRRIGVLVEEQRSQNIYVLDGITNLSDRLEKVEKRITHFEND